MATRTIKKMMGNLPVGVVDVVRLFVEATEVGKLPQSTRGELISAFRRLVHMGAKAVEEAERTLPFGEVVRRSLEARKGRRKSTLADLRSYAGRMVKHGDWAGKPLRGIGPEECREMLHALFGHSPFTYRKGRSVLHSLFAYGIRQGWCDRNPVDAIEMPRVEEKRIEPLQQADIEKLMEASARTDMEPAVTLMLWCGVRPGEVQRLTWEDVDTKEGVVYVSPQHSKTGGARLIPLRGAASKLKNENRKLSICPRNWAKRWRELRHRAGLDRWQPDALRHTFASMHLRRFGNPPLLQAEMGHRDSSLLRTRYVNMRHLTARAAAKFWNA